MNNILVADIFGKTPALIGVANAIKADIIVDPYDGKSMGFASEIQAYHCFTKNVGLENYREKLLLAIKQCSGECVLIGFSVGAAIIWMMSAVLPAHLMKKIKFAVCYYGSQIRHYTEISPLFEVKCIFPIMERHFDVCALQSKLQQKEKVTTMQVDYLHGFMNTHSDNFNQVGYKTHIRLLQEDINISSLST